MELINVFEHKPINKISIISLDGSSQVMMTLSKIIMGVWLSRKQYCFSTVIV